MDSRVMDRANREIMETQSIHIFTSLSTLIALQVLTRPQADGPLCSSSPCYITDEMTWGPGWGGGR